MAYIISKWANSFPKIDHFLHQITTGKNRNLFNPGSVLLLNQLGGVQHLFDHGTRMLQLKQLFIIFRNILKLDLLLGLIGNCFLKNAHFFLVFALHILQAVDLWFFLFSFLTDQELYIVLEEHIVTL